MIDEGEELLVKVADDYRDRVMDSDSFNDALVYVMLRKLLGRDSTSHVSSLATAQYLTDSERAQLEALAESTREDILSSIWPAVTQN